jgi:predicted secreted protein
VGKNVRQENMKIKAIIIAALVLSAISAFAADPCDDKNPIKLTRLNNDQDLVVSVGEWIQIELPALGSAGYTWQISEHEPEFLNLASTGKIDVAKLPVVGAPVDMVWCLQAVKEGWTEFKLDYYRPWEGVANATDHFIIRVMIIQQETSK